MLATFDGREIARKVAQETGWDVDEYAAGRGWTAVGVGPVGRSRDSDALETSNFRTAQALLDDAGARYATVHFGHWAVGWVDEIAYDAGDPATVAAVASIRARLDEYPVLDEEDYSAQEWADNHPDGRHCYASRDAECHATDYLSRIIPRRDARGRFARA